MITFLKNILIGILIGSGAILPGISSGVILVSLGLYEKLLNTILDFLNNIKENLKLLIPIIVGIILGVILFGNILNALYNLYPNIAKFCFIGLILGTIPSVIKTANKSYKYFEFKKIIFSIITFTITIIMIIAEKNMTSNLITSQFSYFYLVLAGFLMSIGIVVPGISSTVILMLLKIYPTYLSAISTVNMSILFPFAIGIILGGFIFMKLIKLCFDKFHIQTYYAIIGFSMRFISCVIA